VHGTLWKPGCIPQYVVVLFLDILLPMVVSTSFRAQCLTYSVSYTYTVSMSREKQNSNHLFEKFPDLPLPLSRDRILSVALTLVDSQGLEGLSMRNLAQLMGVKAMSLYNHVKNKDDIIDELVDQVLGEVSISRLNEDTSWITFMKVRAISLYQALSSHPWAIIASISRVTTGPNRLQLIEDTLKALNQGGIPLPLADHIMNALDSFTYGFVLQEINMPIQKEDYSEAAKHYLPTIETARYPNFTLLAEEIVKGSYDGINHFEFGLDLLLKGLEIQTDTLLK